MIVAGARVEIDINDARFDAGKKAIEAEGRKHRRASVVIKLFAIGTLHFRFDEKSIVQFRSGVVLKVVKTPIRLRAELA